jgi:hypothetical protein
MPAKNRIKEYFENSYYHLYNRGVDKRPIFTEQQDYAVFLSYLKTYLVPKNPKDFLSYQSFVEGPKGEELETIGKLILEEY